MKKLRFPNNLKDFKNMFFTPKLTIFCIFLTFIHVCSRKMVIIIHKMWMAIWWNMDNAKRKYAVTQLCQKWVFCPKTEMCEKTLKMLYINMFRSSYGEYRKIHSVDWFSTASWSCKFKKICVLQNLNFQKYFFKSEVL